MIGILVISHGLLAQGLYESTKLFINDLENVEVVILEETDTPQAFYSKLENKILKISDEHGILILSDILGGTTTNQALLLLQKKMNIKIVTGVNLVMLIEALITRNNIFDLDILSKQVLETGQKSITILDNSSLTSNSEISLDDLDDIL